MERKVILRRKEVLNHLPKEIRAGAKVKLGSIYVNRLPLKGVEGEEEATLLKSIIKTPANHPDFADKSHEFWASLSVKVPFEGVELDISTFDEDGKDPVNPMDYLIYKWATKHKHVALSEEEMKTDSNKRFYIYDPQKDLLKKNARVQIKKDADKEFIKLTEDKMKTLLRVLVNGNPDRLTPMEIENSLYDYKEKNAERFLKYCKDENLEIRAEIEEMVEKEVLRKIGNQLVFQDETIGEDMKDAIVYFKNKKNSGQLNTMRTRLKEVS